MSSLGQEWPNTTGPQIEDLCRNGWSGKCHNQTHAVQQTALYSITSSARPSNGRGDNSFFDAKVIPSVAYTYPEVGWVGLTENEAKARGIKYRKGYFPGRRADARCPSVVTRGSPRRCSTRIPTGLSGCATVGQATSLPRQRLRSRWVRTPRTSD